MLLRGCCRLLGDCSLFEDEGIHSLDSKNASWNSSTRKFKECFLELLHT
uniref:Uncharacterized protein n=1 Tax=Lepeophtheirus salmonis TaxID=72036 RepID=A0A0K2VDL7_LEPSM